MTGETEKYYQKYWKNGGGKGIFDSPPVWSEKNLLWHWNFFKEYVGKKILDAGAGEGTFLNFLASREEGIEKAVALEISEEAIRIGREKYPRLDFQKGAMEEMDFAPESFDTIFAVEVLEHILDVEECLSQISRTLKKGGFFCVTTTDFNWPKKIIIAAFFWDRFFSPASPHIRFFTKKTLISICRKYDLERVDYKWNRSWLGLMPKGQMAVFQKVDETK